MTDSLSHFSFHLLFNTTAILVLGLPTATTTNYTELPGGSQYLLSAKLKSTNFQHTHLLLKQNACLDLWKWKGRPLIHCATLFPNEKRVIYNQMSYTGKYQIIRVAMHKHEYGYCGLNGYTLPIHYNCIFTICLISFLGLTRDLLIMLPRGGQLLIGREAGEIEGYLFSSAKKIFKILPFNTKWRLKTTDIKKRHNVLLPRELCDFAKLFQGNKHLPWFLCITLAL